MSSMSSSLAPDHGPHAVVILGFGLCGRTNSTYVIRVGQSRVTLAHLPGLAHIRNVSSRMLDAMVSPPFDCWLRGVRVVHPGLLRAAFGRIVE